MAVDPRRRSDEPSCWFDDGNIVLQAEQTLFKVYKGILSRESEVFKTLLSLPRFATLLEAEKYEDSQLVVLQDQTEDIATLLRAINDYRCVPTTNARNICLCLIASSQEVKAAAFTLRCLCWPPSTSVPNCEERY